MRLIAAAALAFALAVPATASGHATVTPPFVEDGVETEITFETPSERPPHATTAVSVTAPAGILVVSAEAPAGWQVVVNDATVTWSGGLLADGAIASFPMRALARTPAGTYSFAAAQTYDDGATVEWKAALNVLPATGAAAPKQQPWSAVAAALVGVAVIAGSLVLLRFLRRRSLQKQ